MCKCITDITRGQQGHKFRNKTIHHAAYMKPRILFSFAPGEARRSVIVQPNFCPYCGKPINNLQ